MRRNDRLPRSPLHPFLIFCTFGIVGLLPDLGDLIFSWDQTLENPLVFMLALYWCGCGIAYALVPRYDS